MHVSLTPKLEELVRHKVASGLYNNASEVVREALRLMAEQDQVYQLKLERLRGALAEGEASGAATEFDFDAFMAELDDEADRGADE
ncbi:MAG: type II toxin-antitoxin system ParD family antitoxin [Alphaproteobacteria bacterium]|jgi:antitoxin ParD1/3/4|nr:type II toxin-antitoxin system ParD family antitoxin [Alphaproteobacteria bacterium]MDP6814270.1 type II toxin-antitoxin system ParD family antitoxin [Alphaproteobacteria bacterium]|tara:strand:- start:417 stop:674 length:258 start_codon:yes stop_codon:yes gene_type:complete